MLRSLNRWPHPKRTRKSYQPTWKRRRAISATGIAEKVLGYAKEQGWLTKAEDIEATPETEQRVKLPEPKPDG